MTPTRSRLETPLAVFTLAVLVPYAMAETYHYFAFVGFGNGVLNYLVDLIAMALLLAGAVSSLKHRAVPAAGWLAAAWGFAACLNYRSFSWRFEFYQEGQDVSEPVATVYLLGASLLLSFMALGVALYASRPRA